MENTKPNLQNTTTNPKHAMWDCGSSLYDSFELKAFEKQLDSAISSRTMSMPHLSDRRYQAPAAEPPPPVSKKPASRISRSLHRLIRSVFGHKSNNSGRLVQEGFYDKSAALSTIPEAPEFDGLSPEIRSLVRRTASDRFSAATSIGISCA